MEVENQTEFNVNIDPTNKSWIKYFPFLPETLSLNEEQFEELWNLHPKEKGIVKIMGKEIETPRWQQAYGQSYAFSGTVNKALPFHPIILKYVNWANEQTKNEKEEFNMALLNWYENGDHYIGHHSDDEKQLIQKSPIYCFSFGASRDFVLKNKITKENTKVELENNSLIIMGGTCQKTHTHTLPKRKKVNEKRISITLRKFK